MQTLEQAARTVDNKGSVGHGNGKFMVIICMVCSRTPNKQFFTCIHGTCLKWERGKGTHLKYLPSFLLNIYMSIQTGTTLVSIGQGLCSPVPSLPSLKSTAMQQAMTLMETLWPLTSAHMFPTKPPSNPCFPLNGHFQLPGNADRPLIYSLVFS